jgi:hypothetical protein
VCLQIYIEYIHIEYGVVFVMSSGQRSNVINTTFVDSGQFPAKKMAIFLIMNVIVYFFAHKYGVSSQKIIFLDKNIF